ncbi:hypothetical protein F5Y17DRAFT_461608 [Xylariaceae sp. FL0594]|nr:hypothetical protein F5Y17DRAFT_461608 [Xylariaceae sp. FL0594]
MSSRPQSDQPGPWAERMGLPTGEALDPAIKARARKSIRKTDQTLALEDVIRREMIRLGVTHAWICADRHGTSSYGYTPEGERKRSDDDWHVTLRLGTRPDWCVLHGHFYIVYDDNDDPAKSTAVRMMLQDERGIVDGKNPQMYTWGPLPAGYDASEVKFPTPPFKVIPGSILDKRRKKT